MTRAIKVLVGAACIVGFATPSQALRVTAAGDIAGPGYHQRATAKLIAAVAPKALLTLGDNQYPCGAYANFLEYYDKSWGAFKRKTNPAPGNHDYDCSNGAGYFRYFGTRAHKKRGYYSYNLGDWHLVSLNTEIDSLSAEAAWLRTNLTADHHRCDLIYMHRPRWSSGGHGSEDYWNIFVRPAYKAGVDILLSGHDHDYERFAKQDPRGHVDRRGIRQFVVGTGGATLSDIGKPEPHSQSRDDSHFGVLVLRLRPAGYRWGFRATKGTVRDSGASSCHA